MKKFLILFVFSLLSFGNITHASFKPSEVILLKQNNFEIKSDAFIRGENNKISVVKNSNILVFFADKALIDNEPVIKVNIKRKDGDSVFSVKSPAQKMSGDSSGLDKYLLDNKDYFDSVKVGEDQVNISIPINLDAGEYDLFVNVDFPNKKNNLKHSFNVAKSPYVFKITDIFIEDYVIFANISYLSFANKDEINKVVISVKQDDRELFSKEIEKTLYSEGDITINEQAETLKSIKGSVDVKIEIKNSNNEVLVSETKNIKIGKTSTKYIYYIIIGLLIVLTILTFVFIKIKKTRVLVMILIVTASFFTSFNPIKTKAQEMCGGVGKPLDKCIEGLLVTSVCELTETCDQSVVSEKKDFSTGEVLSIISPRIYVGPTNASVNICNNVKTTLSNGASFYVTSDSMGSAWQVKRYHIFEFVKGVKKTVTFDPGGRKRNISSAVYDGSCNVIVSSKYAGADSDHRLVQTTIIEVGVKTPDICRSPIVNTDTFESNGDLIQKSVCTGAELLSTYMIGSVYVGIMNTSPWKDKTVNICNYLGSATNNNGKAFYTLMEQTSSWTEIRFPIFEFVFGTPSVKYVRALNGGDESTVYYYDARKENTPTVKYDGGCNVTYRLYNYGENTDSWSPGYKLLETGMVSNAVCRDARLVAPSVYKYSGRGLYDGEVEHETKKLGGKYDKIASFFKSLGDCQFSEMCSTSGEWIDSATDTDCTTATSTICGGAVEVPTADKPISNLCLPSATSSSFDVSSSTFDWVCSETAGSQTNSCSVKRLSSCGSADAGTTDSFPITDLCVSGFSSRNSLVGATSFSWQCFHGDVISSCVSYKTDLPGVCGSANGSGTTTRPTGSLACSAGSLSDMNQNGNSFTWRCEGNKTPYNDGDCSSTKDEGGGSDVTAGSCAPLDGIVLANNQEKTFFSSRIAGKCIGKLAKCLDGELFDIHDKDFASSTFRYKSCVEPGFNEF